MARFLSLGWFRQPPTTGDTSVDRHALLIYRVLWFLLLAVPFVVVLALLNPDNPPEQVAWTYAPIVLLLMGCFGLVHHRRAHAAAWLLTGVLWLFVTISVVLFGGLRDNGVGYVLAVIVAGTCVGGRAAWVVAGASILATAVLAYAEVQGLVPRFPLHDVPLNAWIALTTTMVLAAALHNMALTSLDRALRESSRVVRELRKTRAENESRALHGATVGVLGELALQMTEPKAFFAEVSERLRAILFVDRVMVLESQEGETAKLVAGAGWDVAPEASTRLPPLFQTRDSRPRPLDAETLASLVAAFDLGNVQSGTVACILGRPRPFGWLVVMSFEPKSLTAEESLFVATVAGLVATAIERVRAEQRGQHAQKIELVGRLAGGIAHDFNNLLVVMSAVAAELRGLVDDRGREAVEDLTNATERAVVLTRQLLGFSRRQVQRPEHVELRAVLHQLQPMLRRLLGADVAVVFQLGEQDLPIHADRGNLEQVFLNLLVNARDAMPHGGRIDLDARLDGDAILVRVTDNGDGMDEDTCRQVFEPFFTTKVEGTGLGLATVAQIMERLGGEISVQSTLGKGTTFTLRFIRDADFTQAESVPPVRETAGQGVVLLVEDHALVRTSTTRMLRSLGYRVTTATNGHEALELLENGLRFDLLISDITMPDMGGTQLAEELNARSIVMPIVFISGYTDEAPAIGAKLSQTVRFVSKPFTKEALGQAVSACLREQVSDQPPARLGPG